VYGVLLVTQVWNAVATVLLYALMCCIYAALFGTGAYFCPVLMSLLKPSLMNPHYRGLTARLLACSALIMGVFLAHTIGYARLVVAPPVQVQWWWKYGALELFPAVAFLAMMSPSSNKARRQQGATPTPPQGPTPPKGSFKRIDSTGSTASAGTGFGGTSGSGGHHHSAAYRSAGAGHRHGGSGGAAAPWSTTAGPSQTPTPPPPPPPPATSSSSGQHQHQETTSLLRGTATTGGGAGGYGAAAAPV
jgi:hypothetical protein